MAHHKHIDSDAKLLRCCIQLTIIAYFVSLAERYNYYNYIFIVTTYSISTAYFSGN